MTKLRQIALALATSALICAGSAPQSSSAQGSAPNFERYVSMGDSLTAGFQDGSLYDGSTRVDAVSGAPEPTAAGQRSGYVVHVAASMGTPMVQPYISWPGTPGLLELNAGPCVIGNFTPVAPRPYLRVNAQVPANDVGVPGQSMVTAVTTKWSIDPTDLTTINTIEDLVLGLPYAFAGVPPRTQLETAMALQPTFATVWLGNNDALGAAIGADAKLLTPTATFKTNAEMVFHSLETLGIQGVVATIPDVTVVPHMVSQPTLKAILGAAGFPADDANIKLLFGVNKTDYIPMTALVNVQAIIANPASGPLPANKVLTKKEVKKIKKAVKAYNKVIVAEAEHLGWAVVDANAILEAIKANGLTVPGVGRLTTNYLGGVFSLDGVHPSVTGYAIVADAFVQAINAKYGTTLARVDIAAVSATDPLHGCIAPAKAPEEMTLEDYLRLMPAIQSGADGFMGRVDVPRQ